MTLAQAVVSFALVAGLVTITPGLDTAMVLRATLRSGRTAGFLVTLGVICGVLVWGLAAALGVSALLAASSMAYDVLRFVGAAYMIWLGARMLLSAVRGTSHGFGLDGEADDAPDAPGAGGGPAAFRAGFLTNLLNPKVGAFYVALLPHFLPAGVPAAAAGAVLALTHGLETLAWLGALTLAAHSLRGFLTGRAAARGIDGITGTVLVGFGTRLALESR